MKEITIPETFRIPGTDKVVKEGQKIKINERNDFVDVVVYGGRIISFSQDEIYQMLNNKKEFEMADNLPKWLFVAVNVENITSLGIEKVPNTFKAIWSFLEKLYNSNGATINVRSDKRSENGITWK